MKKCQNSFSIHRPRAFIFDGAFPYRGMLNGIRIHDDGLLKVWVRRGTFKEKIRTIFPLRVLDSSMR